MPDTTWSTYDRVCTEHDDCGYIQHIYPPEDGEVFALIAFDDPGGCTDTWRLSDLYPEGGE